MRYDPHLPPANNAERMKAARALAAWRKPIEGADPEIQIVEETVRVLTLDVPKLPRPRLSDLAVAEAAVIAAHAAAFACEPTIEAVIAAMVATYAEPGKHVGLKHSPVQIKPGTRFVHTKKVTRQRWAHS